MIRKATLQDAQQIRELIDSFAQQDLMISRSLNEIYENIRDYWVHEVDGLVVGCCALHVFGWDGLVEIKSLAVKEAYQKKGISKQLIEACLHDARGLLTKKVFVLTYVPELFKKFGFIEVDKQEFPQKIWE
ncbi:N-acetyltransferase, partial [Candidatus Omnitrophota bacterium]